MTEELQQEEELREDHRRLHFRPYVYIKHERSVPRSITCVAFTGDDRYKRIRLPAGVPFLSDGQQIALVRDAIQRHISKTGGMDPMFDRITGYIYRKTYDFSIEFSPDGRIVSATTEEIPEPVPTLKIGGRTVEGGLLKQVTPQSLHRAEE